MTAKRTEPVLSTDSEERKRTPIYSGLIAYAPLALAAMARVSQRGNDKHNPGQPLHHNRDKSGDHLDCVARHLCDAETYNEELGEYEDAACMAWRAVMFLQELEEGRLGKGLPPGARKSPQPAEPATPARASWICLFCQGSGFVDGRTCGTCRGSGFRPAASPKDGNHHTR